MSDSSPNFELLTMGLNAEELSERTREEADRYSRQSPAPPLTTLWKSVPLLIGIFVILLLGAAIISQSFRSIPL